MLVPSKPCCQNVFSASCRTSSGSNSLLLMPLTRPSGLIWQECSAGGRVEAGRRQRSRASGSDDGSEVRGHVLRGSGVRGSSCAAEPWRRLRNLVARHLQDFVSSPPLFGCAPAERIRQPSRQLNSGNPNEICASPNLMLLLKRHSRRQSSVTKRPAIANTDEPSTGGLSCCRA